MAFTIHLGVIELPYAAVQPPSTRRAVVKVRRRGGKAGPVQRSMRSANAAKTTGDIAEILEWKYHVMEIFAQIHEKQIADIIAGHMQDALDNILMGAPPQANIFPAEGIPELQKMFVRWINKRGMDGIQPGVPTKAAQMGVNHRMKHPYQRRASRPSFRDTGLYLQAFRAWVSQR